MHARTRLLTTWHCFFTRLPTSPRSIGLLKVDTECADLIVLQGIKQADWAMIRQVAMEVRGRLLTGGKLPPGAVEGS
jgi:hypothetical protein